MRRAFDLGVTHFDLANNYGPPYGAAETNVGRILQRGLRALPPRAGHLHQGGVGHVARDRTATWAHASTCSTPWTSRWRGCDSTTSTSSTTTASTRRRRWRRRSGALDTAVRQGKARYVGISSYSGERTREAVSILRELGTPLLIHQPSYSMLNRWIEEDLLDVLGEAGVGCIGFSPLAQGMLTSRYLDGVPEGSRAQRRTRACRTSC